MTCKCSPSLVRLMADFAARGHINSGCCGDAAHQARKSDHNPDASGYAHAQDIHEKSDHDMQPFVDFMMANPGLFPQVKYLIYEGHIYYVRPGVRAAGKYPYTGPNAHAFHLHVSIHPDATFYGGDWYVDRAYSQEEDDMFGDPDREALGRVENHTKNAEDVLHALHPLADLLDPLRAYLADPGTSNVDVDKLADRISEHLGDDLAKKVGERLVNG